MGTRPRPTVLIVDDDALILAASKRCLSRDWRVVVASDPATARRLIEAERPHVAVMDIKLVEASGLDLARELKRDRPKTKVALLSGYITIDIAVAATRAGIDAVLPKPCPPNELMRRLAEGPKEPVLGETPSLER